MQTKEEALAQIKYLVERFDKHKDHYKSPDNNETQTRQDFINPFWKALGWDIDNENGYAESDREVIHETRARVGKATKAPDYTFRLPCGKRLFFLETKKPSAAIKDEIPPAYQIRRYGWSAEMPISVITDFGEFAVYDCSIKPKPTDKASAALIKHITYSNYINEFDYIWDTFSKEHVFKGSFDNYTQSDKNKKRTVDADFLASLDKWRVELARNIALRNNINEDELNFLVQKTIDRIVFLRIAEDRNVERYGTLQDLISRTNRIDQRNNPDVVDAEGNYYKNLLQCFHVADQKYNSGLFDFTKDKISNRITIDNKTIKNIISEFYYPACPYEFSVLTVDILGSAYEQYLGKQISMSTGGRATIDEKPEVRKAGGVYYTPQYIVDYIVKNTVGKLTSPNRSTGAELTPEDVAKIKIVDPACGSGRFLIGAYQYLLQWHKDYYTQKCGGTCGRGVTLNAPTNRALSPTGELTTTEKKRILQSNIYGVDLDSNAVEVTKLSLLLKCMEGETKESIEAQSKLLHDRVLPSLDNNIKSGNSLIDLDYYDNQIDFGDERKVKPFSWKNNFPEVFARGGFDCVIGNPPYGAELSNTLQEYCSRKYNVGNSDTAALFMMQARNILRQNGINGFIVPKSFTFASNWAKTRDKLLHDICIIVDCSKVWKEVKLEMSIYVSTNGQHANTFLSCVRTGNEIIEKGSINKELCNEFGFILNGLSEEEIEIGLKLKRNNLVLNDFVENRRGGMFQNMVENRNVTINDFCVLGGKQIGRYDIKDTVKGVIPKNQVVQDKSIIQEQSILAQNIVAHIQNPYPRIQIIATIADETITGNCVILDTVNQLINVSNFSSKYLLGVLNSRITSWYTYRFVFGNAIRTMHFDSTTTGKIPFPKLSLNNRTEKKKHDEIVRHVDMLLLLNREMQTTTLPERVEQIRSRIGYCENWIDRIVYGLYAVTDREIGRIENGFGI